MRNSMDPTFLQKRIQQLEEDLAKHKQDLDAIRQERDEIQHALNGIAWKSVTQEELEKWGNEEPQGLDGQEFLAELEAMLRQLDKAS